MDQNVTQKNNGEEEKQHRLKTDRHTDGQIDKQTDRDGNGRMAGRISPV